MVHRQLHTLHVYYFEWYVLELLYVIIQTREKKSENTENNVLYQAILYMLGDGRLPSYYPVSYTHLTLPTNSLV